MLFRLSFALLFTFSTAFAQENNYLLIGTYTGKSEGIYVYNFNTGNADNSKVSVVKADNPSYIAVSPNQKTVYAVAEKAEATKQGTGGDVVSYSFNAATGTLTEINQRFSYGKHPCYVAIDNMGKWLFEGNYTSGSLAVFPVNANGSLDSVSQVIQHSGSGPNKDRQEGPHVHSTVISPDNKYLFVQDLGLDKVFIYRFDNNTGQLTPGKQPFVSTAPGSGPRHLTFHPNGKYAYLVEEMSADVVAYKYKKGKLKEIQTIHALPADFKGALGSADIHVSPDGKFLYCSNRGDANSITIFKINEKKGSLTVVGHQSTMGKTPRNFTLDPTGNFLLVANQETDNIIIFKVDKATGLLTDTGKSISVSKPVCLKWIKKD